MDADARGRNQWYRLRTLPSNDDAAVASVGVAGGREGYTIGRGSEKRPTRYIASMDVKTAFDVARPRHLAPPPTRSPLPSPPLTQNGEYRIRTGRSQPHYVKWRGFKRDLRECRKQVQVLLVPLPGQRRSSNATAQKWRSRICGAWRKSGRGGEGSILTDVEVTVNCAVFSGVVEHPRGTTV